jgi:hypothetical protein
MQRSDVHDIAYENLMIQSKPARPSAIRDSLGPSRCIDVHGRGQDKWCQAEGEAVLDLLRRLRASGCEPDISRDPFVVVQNLLCDLVRRGGLLEENVLPHLFHPGLLSGGPRAKF